MSEPSYRPYRRKHAVALQYAEGDKAPRIVASGAGEVAKRILQLAAEHQVPIQEDDGLIDILANLEVGYEIPPETYRAVAEILAFLYRTDKAWRSKKESEHSLFSARKNDTQPSDSSAS